MRTRVLKPVLFAISVITIVIICAYFFYFIPIVREGQAYNIFSGLKIVFADTDIITDLHKKRIKIFDYSDLHRYVKNITPDTMPVGLYLFETPSRDVDVFFVKYSNEKPSLFEIDESLLRDGVVSVSDFSNRLSVKLPFDYGCEVFIVESLTTQKRLAVVSYADFFIKNSTTIAQSCLIEELIHGITGWADAAVSLPFALDSILANPPNFNTNTYVFPTTWDKEQFNKFLDPT